MDFVFLDTETTGLEEKDEVIQLAYVVSKDGKKFPMNKLYKPTVPISYKAMAVHHITPEIIEASNYGTLDMNDVLMRGLEKLNTVHNVAVAHNIQFDLGMLERHGFKSKMQAVDTLRCAKHLLKDAEGHSLGVLFYQYNLYKKMDELADEVGVDIKNMAAHDALYDVLMLMLLTRMLLRLVDNKIDKLVELSMTPVFIEVFAFGKYKGERVEDVANNDRSYLEWMLNKMDGLDEDMRHTLTTILGA